MNNRLIICIKYDYKSSIEMPGIGVGERRVVENSTRIFRPSISMPEHFFKASSESS